jgi:ankyrin repeat protein
MNSSSASQNQGLKKTSQRNVNPIENQDTHSPISIVNSPRINSVIRENQQEQINSQKILKELYHAITTHQKNRTPEFSEIENVCKRLKNAEQILISANSQIELNQTCDQIRSQLPRFFKKIQQYSDLQKAHSLTLDIETIHTICLGLSALANPTSEIFLTKEQCLKCQDILTNISQNFCTALNKPIQHGSLRSGKLLNILNWYSRGMKSDLLDANNKEIKKLFQLTLLRLQDWVNGTGDDGWITSKQLSKCMVQLNTMINLKIISIENTKEGKSNRLAWSETVSSLCQYFLSNQVWLTSCNIIELINVTNTLKVGIDQNILSIEVATMHDTLNCICKRIKEQSFTLNSQGELNSLTNCCNFLRCLYEHNLVGSSKSNSGLAMLKLVNTIYNFKSDEKYHNNPQAIINIASFIKSADRWMQEQENFHEVLRKKEIQEIVIAIIKKIEVLCQNENSGWLHSSVSNSGLLSALEYFIQRRLIPAKQESSLVFILRTMLNNISNWHQNNISNVSILLALRTLASLEDFQTLFTSIKKSGALKKSLASLLNYLKQNYEKNSIAFSKEEKIVTLQMIRLGIILDITSINDHQDLLMHIIRIKNSVNLEQIEAAILEFNGTLKQINTVDTEDTLTNQDDNEEQATPFPTSPALNRGPTYWGNTSEKQATQINLIHTNSTAQEKDWISIPYKFSNNQNSGNLSSSSSTTTQLPLEKTKTIPVIAIRKEKVNSETKFSLPDNKFISESENNKNKKDQTISKNKNISRQQAKIEWFNLLKKEKTSSLKEIQNLAALYPDLISIREVSKKGKPGANAMHYALTLGKIELTSWLIKQNNPIAGQSFGDFLESVILKLTIIENKHAQAIHHFVSSQVQMAARKGEIILMTPAQIDYAKEIHEIKNILDKYELLTNFRYFLGYGLVGNYRKNNLNKKNESIFPYLSSGMSLEKFDMDEFLKITYQEGFTHFTTLLKHSSKEEIEFTLSQVKDKSALIFSSDPHNDALFNAMGNVSKNRLDIISLILDSVEDKDKLIYSVNIDGLNALSFAIEYRLNDVVTLLLDYASDPDHLAITSSYVVLTSLMHAAEMGNHEIVKTLLSKVKNTKGLAQLADANGNTALMFAAVRNRTDVIKVLLKEVPDSDQLLTQMTIHGETAYDIALKNNYSHLLEMLRPIHYREQLQLTQTKLDTVIATSNFHNHSEIINSYSISEQFTKNHMIFCGAVNGNNIALAKFYIRTSFDVEELIRKKNLNGTTPLMMAVKNNNIDMIDLLLNTTNDKQSLILDHSHEGINAFMIAAMEGYIGVLEKLLHSVDDKEKLIYAQFMDGSNALMIAIKYNHLGIAKLILETVRDPSHLAQTKMNSGLTSLMIAAGLGNKLGFTLLLAAVRDPSALVKMADLSGNTALIYAVEGNHFSVIKAILDAVPDKKSLLTHLNSDGETAYTTALTYNYRHLLSFLDPNG